MIILYGFIGGNLKPLSCARIWALERLVSIDCAFGDIRGAITLLALRSFTAIWAILVRNIAGRAWQGARFAAGIADADSMVAAGGN
jgi:hypothetical protein